MGISSSLRKAKSTFVINEPPLYDGLSPVLCVRYKASALSKPFTARLTNASTVSEYNLTIPLQLFQHWSGGRSRSERIEPRQYIGISLHCEAWINKVAFKMDAGILVSLVDDKFRRAVASNQTIVAEDKPSVTCLPHRLLNGAFIQVRGWLNIRWSSTAVKAVPIIVTCRRTLGRWATCLCCSGITHFQLLLQEQVPWHCSVDFKLATLVPLSLIPQLVAGYVGVQTSVPRETNTPFALCEDEDVRDVRETLCLAAVVSQPHSDATETCVGVTSKGIGRIFSE